MNLRFISSFVATADLGSFSKAAEALFSTQATIASRVAKLEEELGVSLFIRAGSQLVLTDHGHAALPDARRLLSCAEDFTRAAGDRRLQGVYRIAVTGYISALLGAEFLTRAYDSFPELQFEMYTQSSTEVLERLQEGRIDLGILVGTELRPALKCEQLFELPLRWIARADVPGADLPGLAALNICPVISYPAGTLPCQAIELQFERHAIQPPRMLWIDSLDVLLPAVRAGLGACLMPPSLVEDDLAAGVLTVLDAEPAIESMSFHAHYRDNARRSVTKALVGIMRQILNADQDRPA